MFRGIVVILIPIVLIGLVLIAIIIGLVVLTAIRATIMAFRGDTDDEVESDGFLVEYGINSLNISAIF
ncbi:hypothetical protein KVC78_00990 [Helicobacter pylori]|uniref:hypothetical protein n=1 Tax=Helicobacter pylori TaxID=210 RepID=UPI0009945A70|nr:hypothetical protein [Helicobacter pylori]OOQ07626.1 hypothetical protein B0X40_01130 [Helicobacter pylori]PDW85362.1 hypothetical protein BB385_01600 [Helicobacter pylori]WQU55231.1 hypothetical protein KVC78_00990 [Helicobacter pylori]